MSLMKCSTVLWIDVDIKCFKEGINQGLLAYLLHIVIIDESNYK